MKEPLDRGPVAGGAGGVGLTQGTVCAAFQALATRVPDRPALRMHGERHCVTWGEYAERVRRLAAGLAGIGVRAGDTVALLLVNRPEFHFVDMAAVHLGAVPFSLYNTSPADQLAQRLRTAGSRVLVTERAFLPVARAASAQVPEIRWLICVDEPDGPGVSTLAELAASGAPDFPFEQTWRAVSPGDVVTLIFTSGTTGPPKAAELSHAGVMGTLRALSGRIPLPREAMISAMPMAHVAERTWTHYMPLAHGATSTCCPDRSQVFACLRETRPDIPFMVPRLWEHLRSTLLARLDSLDDPELRAAVDRRLARIRAGERLGAPGDGEDPAVLRRLREELLAEVGLDRVVVAYMGGAACPRELVESVQALGVPVREGYGLTEATGFAAVLPGVDEFRNGTAGRPLPGVQLTLAEDGEILLRSELNMLGYRGDPENTAHAIDTDGWLHTGDLGTLDDEGFLSVVGRKKDLIISSYGKNMSPVTIEDAILRESPLLGAAVAIGDARPHNVALLTLDPAAAAAFAERHGLPGRTVAELAADARVLAEVDGAVQRANRLLSRPERIRAHRVLDLSWTPDSTELTATMKIRRAAIVAKYADVVESLYAG